jgi:hypothetical protein
MNDKFIKLNTENVNAEIERLYQICGDLVTSIEILSEKVNLLSEMVDLLKD